MRISDWSSDVCSSDLTGIGAVLLHVARPERPARGGRRTGDRPSAAGGDAGRIARRNGVDIARGNERRGTPVRVRTDAADADELQCDAQGSQGRAGGVDRYVARL